MRKQVGTGDEVGEIFDGVAVTQALCWAGEPGAVSAGLQAGAKDIHRYMLARGLGRGLDVLDMASGEGFGSFFLAQTARSVIGIDLDETTVFHAATTYRADNLEYRVGDPRSIPLPDASVDLVTSFGTIERFYEQDALLREVRRVLRPGGRLVVSCLDSAVALRGTADADPPHVRELSRAEFTGLLHGCFGHVVLAGQRTLSGSVIVADRAGPSAVTTFERRGKSRFEVSDGLPRCPTLLAVASDAPLPPLPDSLFIDGDTSAAESEAAQLVAEELAKVKAVLDGATVYARHLESEIENRMRDIADLRAHIAVIEARLPA